MRGRTEESREGKVLAENATTWQDNMMNEVETYTSSFFRCLFSLYPCRALKIQNISIEEGNENNCPFSILLSHKPFSCLPDFYRTARILIAKFRRRKLLAHGDSENFIRLAIFTTSLLLNVYKV